MSAQAATLRPKTAITSPRPQPVLTRRKGLEIARRFLNELESHQLEVVLVPAPDPRHSMHMIRAVQFASPEWYQDFCAMFETAGRKRRTRAKFQTRIKRQDTLRGLRELIEGREETVYAQRLADFIRQEWRRFI